MSTVGVEPVRLSSITLPWVRSEYISESTQRTPTSFRSRGLERGVHRMLLSLLRGDPEKAGGEPCHSSATQPSEGLQDSTNPRAHMGTTHMTSSSRESLFAFFPVPSLLAGRLSVRIVMVDVNGVLNKVANNSRKERTRMVSTTSFPAVLANLRNVACSLSPVAECLSQLIVNYSCRKDKEGPWIRRHLGLSHSNRQQRKLHHKRDACLVGVTGALVKGCLRRHTSVRANEFRRRGKWETSAWRAFTSVRKG
jgi:hypothetical protein